MTESESTFIRGRLATEADVKEGRAVFYQANFDPHLTRAADVEIPRQAIFRDAEGREHTITVIQAEFVPTETDKLKCCLGYRYGDGSLGICEIGEVRWL